MARKHPRSYPPEFRRNIIELVRSGRTMDGLSTEFKIARQTIANWIRQDDLDTGLRSDGLTSAEHDEVSKLRKRVRQLEIERDILSKARGLVRTRDRFDSHKQQLRSVTASHADPKRARFGGLVSFSSPVGQVRGRPDLRG
jgi:transposase